VGVLVNGLAPNGQLTNASALIRALLQYAEIIDPWARNVAGVMVNDVARRDESLWKTAGKMLGRELKKEILYAPTGRILSQLQDEQVSLIKSIPEEAAERVHRLAEMNIVTGARAATIAKEIMATEGVSKSKAMLIARTETSRAASNLVQARAQYAGSDGYFWRTSKDSDVRPSHAAMEGRFVNWNEPPTLDKMKGHAGCFPNCRCYAEPHFPTLGV